MVLMEHGRASLSSLSARNRFGKRYRIDSTDIKNPPARKTHARLPLGSSFLRFRENKLTPEDNKRVWPPPPGRDVGKTELEHERKRKRTRINRSANIMLCRGKKGKIGGFKLGVDRSFRAGRRVAGKMLTENRQREERVESSSLGTYNEMYLSK